MAPQPHIGFLLKNVQTAIDVSWPSAVWLKKQAKEVAVYDAEIDQHVEEALKRGFVLPTKKAKKAAKTSLPTPAKPVQQALPEEQKVPVAAKAKLYGLALVLVRRRNHYLELAEECLMAGGGDEPEEWAVTLKQVSSNLRDALLILQDEPHLTEPELVVRCGALTPPVTDSIKERPRGR